MTVSVLIITLDEEANLQRCLNSLVWTDDIVVLDSFSKDATEDIAKKNGVRFLQRQFDSYAGQRNYGLKQVQYKHDWLLMLDADEIVTDPLAREIETAINTGPSDIGIYRMRRKDHFMGRWIKRSSGYPTWFGRLMRIDYAWIERDVNEEYHTGGEIGFLQEHLLHHPFNKGFSEWFQKHNRYSDMEAKHRFNQQKNNIQWHRLFQKDPQARRVELKAIFYLLPARPLVAFVYLYLLKGGILEGRAGLTFCVLRSIYEYMIDVKTRELKLKHQNEIL